MFTASHNPHFRLVPHIAINETLSIGIVGEIALAADLRNLHFTILRMIIPIIRALYNRIPPFYPIGLSNPGIARFSGPIQDGRHDTFRIPRQDAFRPRAVMNILNARTSS